MCINLDLDLEENIDYILPASSELRPHEIKFPASYRFLLSLYLDLLHKSHVKKLNTAIEKIKPLQLHISYQDIADNVIEKKYKFEVNIYFSNPWHRLEAGLKPALKWSEVLSIAPHENFSLSILVFAMNTFLVHGFTLITF